MALFKIVWHWIDEDGYIYGKTIFSADNMDAVLREYRQCTRLATYGWFDIVKED